MTLFPKCENKVFARKTSKILEQSWDKGIRQNNANGSSRGCQFPLTHVQLPLTTIVSSPSPTFNHNSYPLDGQVLWHSGYTAPWNALTPEHAQNSILPQF